MGRWVEPSTKFSKRRGLTGSQSSDLRISEGGCWVGFTKNPVYRGEGYEKLIYRRELPKKGAWTVCRLWGLAIKKGAFLRGMGG